MTLCVLAEHIASLNFASALIAEGLPDCTHCDFGPDELPSIGTIVCRDAQTSRCFPHAGNKEYCKVLKTLCVYKPSEGM